MKVAEGVSLAYAPLATVEIPLAVDGVAWGVLLRLGRRPREAEKMDSRIRGNDGLRAA